MTEKSNPQEELSRADEIRVLEERLQRLREEHKEPQREQKEKGETPEVSAIREVPSGTPPPAGVPLSAPSGSDEHLHDVKAADLKGYEPPKQLKALVEIAFEQGLKEAVEIAKRLDNAYLLDAFHDTLIDELRKKLVEEGKLREE